MTKLYKNPEYICRYPVWKTLFDCYTADRGVIVGPDYLWMHQQEALDGASGQRLRHAREQRTRYLNLPELVVSLWISFFFRDKPRSGKKVTKLLEKGNAHNNIDGFGTTVEQFMKNILESYLIYGKSIILVDSMPVKAASRAAETKLGLRPFMSLIKPLDAVDWCLNSEDPNRVGAFDYLRYNYTHIPSRKRASEAPTLVEMSDELYQDGDKYAVQRYRRVKDKELSTETEQIKKALDPSKQFGDGEWEEVDSPILTDMDRVPLVQIADESWLKDVNEESLRYYNLRSVNDSVLLHQCYQKLFVTGVDVDDTAERKALTEYIISLLPKDANVISIDPVDTSSLETAMDASLACTLKVALNQLRALPADSRAVQGADTISEEKDNMSALVESTLTEIENAMNQALVLYADFAGEKNFDDKIELCKEVNDEDIDMFLQVWETFATEIKEYPEITGEVVKKALEKLKLPEDKLDGFKRLIDKNPPQKMAIPGMEPQVDENGDPIDEQEAPPPPPKQKAKAKAGKKPAKEAVAA